MGKYPGTMSSAGRGSFRSRGRSRLRHFTPGGLRLPSRTSRRNFLYVTLLVAVAPVEATPPPSDNPLLETITVTASHLPAGALAATEGSVIAVPDSAALAARLPGAALVDNGGLSGEIQYRGLTGKRLLVRINGQRFESGSPNAMDPPLHYAPMPLVRSIKVDRGVSPVSEGPGLGGGFDVTLKRVGFGTGAAFEPHADVTTQYDTNGGSWSTGGVMGLSNDRYRINVIGSHESGGNTRFPGGEIRDSAFRRDVYGASAGMRLGDDELGLEVRRQDTGPTGNPPLPMDILFYHTTFTQATFRGPVSGPLSLDAAIGYDNVRHAMDNFSLRPGPASPMGDRRTNVSSDALTGHFNFTLGSLAHHLGFGIDFEKADRNATILNPMNSSFYVQSLPDVAKDRVGVYLQWRTGFGPIESQLGVRVDHHEMSAAMPRIGPALPMGAQMLAQTFDATDRDWTDNTFDLVANFWSDQGEFTPRVTLARKTHAPSAVERFSWLPTETSGGLADGNVYIGDPNLKVETAWIAEAGVDWRRGGSFVRPTLYYRRIDDYIQGVPYDSVPNASNRIVEMVATMNGDPTPLRFANVGAEFYGADLDFGTTLASHLRLDGTLSAVRGKRTDIRDNVYRISPPNMRLDLIWQRGGWSATLEGIGFAPQHEVSLTNGEQPSGGYALVNLFVRWRAAAGVAVAAGIDNLFDRTYAPHLAGFNRVAESDVPIGARLPAPGRSAFLRLRLLM